jgi:hypothetical protein
MSPKDLKKLAKACREAGITHFKNAEIEFTLSEDAPVLTTKKKADMPIIDQHLETPDAISEEDLLFWSAGGGVN